jgi:hypothetical protein
MSDLTYAQSEDHDYHRSEDDVGKGCCRCCTSSRLLKSSVLVTLFGLVIIGIAQWLPPYVDSAVITNTCLIH